MHGTRLPELSDGDDAAAAGSGGPDAEERAVHHAAPGGRRHENIVAHLRQDLGPQRHQAAILDRDPGSHRHLPTKTLESTTRPAQTNVRYD